MNDKRFLDILAEENDLPQCKKCNAHLIELKDAAFTFKNSKIYSCPKCFNCIIRFEKDES